MKGKEENYGTLGHMALAHPPIRQLKPAICSEVGGMAIAALPPRDMSYLSNDVNLG